MGIYESKWDPKLQASSSKQHPIAWLLENGSLHGKRTMPESPEKADGRGMFPD